MSWFIIIFPIIPLLFWREHRPFSDAPANQVGYIPHYIPMISPLHSHDFPMIFSWYPTLSSCLPMISILYPYEPMHGRFSQLSPMIFQRSPQYTLDIHITLHPYDMPLMVSFIPISHQISRGYPHWIPIWYPFLMINSQRWKTQKKNDNLSHLILLIDWVRWFPRHCWLRPLYCIHIKDPQYIPTCNMLSDMIFIYSPSWSIPIISLIFHNCWFYIYIYIYVPRISLDTSPLYHHCVSNKKSHPHYIIIHISPCKSLLQVTLRWFNIAMEEIGWSWPATWPMGFDDLPIENCDMPQLF